DGIDHVGTVGGNGVWNNDSLPAKPGVWTITYDAGAMDTSMWIFGFSDVVTNEVYAETYGVTESENCSIVVTLKDLAPLPSTLLGNVQLEGGNGTVNIEIQSIEASYNWTGQNGYYEFFDIEPGEYLVNAYAPGHTDFLGSVFVSDGERVQYDILLTVADAQPPAHYNETPSVNGYSMSTTPTISVDILDPSGIDTSSIKFYVSGYRIFHSTEVIVGGYRISYTHEAGFNMGDFVPCRIVASDNFGNTLDWSWSFQILHSHAIELLSGWNMISLPLIQVFDSPEDVFCSLEGIWDVAQCYDATDVGDPWKTYYTFKPPCLNDLQKIDHTMGIWLHVSNASTLTVYGLPLENTAINLCTGWNLIGFPVANGNNMTVLDLKTMTGADTIEGFDPLAEYMIATLPDEYVLKLGEAYWVHMPFDSVWVINQ
ncbi:MAG: carboxypeptidase regulatory-like domain-containing protein, partial [Thermoplasmata archaeon]|nr:carboxypeptidase regulatory-like domain-containing protein [Thermoplasmata archaeon]